MAWERQREAFGRQESNGVLFFRVFVMLSCLILVPLAAIFGSAFPELVREQLVDRIKMLTGSDEPVNNVSAAFAERRATATEAPRWNTAEPAPAWQPAVSPAMTQQVDYQAEVAQATPSVPEEPANPPQTVDHFTEIQHRLRDYGATHYALESIQGDVSRYRFRCSFPGVTADRPQLFESVDRDPLQAMANVLGQVEAWRARLASNRENNDLYWRR